MSKIINNIDEQINIIQSSLEWANKYNKGAFPKREFKESKIKLMILSFLT